MLLQSHFIAFNDIKSKDFSNALKYSSLYVNSCICQPVAQELDKLTPYMCVSFVDLLRESVS